MVRSGGGAAVASGASFQARVAAYLITTLLCDSDSPITLGTSVRTMSFETGEAVDDLNVELGDNQTLYVQAKAALNYSTHEDSQLYSVLDQFVRQHLSKRSLSKYVLVTSGRASKKLIYDFRAALEAYRLAPEAAFKRDQPKAIQEIIGQIHAALRKLIEKHGGESADIDPDAIIKAMHVAVLDLEQGAPLEEASIILLQANGFLAPRAVWGKLVSDALSHAKQRDTIRSKDIQESYDRYRARIEVSEEVEAEADLLQVEFGDMQFPSGKEVVLCNLSEDSLGIGEGLAILEMYRFDERCEERCKFTDDKVQLLNGLELELIRRSATVTGMSRVLEAQPEIVGDRAVTIMPMNTDEDFEVSSCAELHRERLKAAALRNPAPQNCLHCGKPVSTNHAAVVEVGTLMEPQVGMVHDSCLLPRDRIIGLAQSEFFQEFPELINFDANEWFKAAHGGQMAFYGVELNASKRSPVLAWGGRDSTGPLGDYVVEVALQNGEREIVTERNAVHRFNRDEAEAFVARLNEQFDNGRETNDPFCYSDQSKVFGPRSLVLELIGGREVIRPVERARVRKFQTEFAARYSRPGQWYAPLMYLVRTDTDEPVGMQGYIFLITDPLTLGNHLSNWRQTGLLLNDYEVRVITTDIQFDEFMRWSEDAGFSVVTDPIFDLATGEPTSGVPIVSMEAITGTG